MFDDNIAPIPKPDVDFGSLSAQPTPEQYFLLSRINGELTVAELCRVSGLPKEQTLEALQQLVDHGLIEIPGGDGEREAEQVSEPEAPGHDGASAQNESIPESAQEPDEFASGSDEINHAFVDSEASFASDSSGAAASSSSTEEAPETSAESAASAASAGGADESSAPEQKSSAPEQKEQQKKKKKKKKRDVTPNYPVPPSDFEFDQELLSLDIPLDDEQRRQALCLYEQIEQMSFYDLFGVEPDASRRDIKRAYFRLSKRYHPDKFFRKELHDFGPIL